MGFKTLILQSGDGSTRVEYKTDITGNPATEKVNFTVSEVVGLTDDLIHQGFPNQLVDTSIQAFEDAATTLGMKLSFVSPGDAETVIIDETSDSSSS